MIKNILFIMVIDTGMNLILFIKFIKINQELVKNWQ
jgi:hypothetical protein